MSFLKKKKEAAYRYSKPIKNLGDCKTGDYVYSQEADLCEVEVNPEKDEYNFYSYGISSWRSKDTIVYPITLENTRIVKQMQELRDKYHKSCIMNADFNRELQDGLHELMLVDINDDKYSDKMNKVWSKLNKRYEELLSHARFLHLV